MHIFVVHNPVSGTSDFEAVRSALVDHFNHAGVRFDHHVTEPDEPIAEIVADAVGRGVDLVAAVGGDGTVSATANGLIGTGIPLGVIPQGSGNAFARELDIPLELKPALSLLTGSARRRQIDTIVVGERHYVLNVSAGLSTQAVVSTEREQKRRLGKLAYLAQGLGSLAGMHLQRFTIFVDGRRIRTRASEVIAANSGVIGFKGVRLSPQVRPDDGLMHVGVVKADTLGSYLRLLAAALRGSPDQLPELHCIPVKESVRIEADRQQAVQGDGEEIGVTPVEVELAAGSLHVLVPEEGE